MSRAAEVDGRETVQPEGIASVWDKVSERYSAQSVNQPHNQAFFRVFMETTGVPKGRSYCEVGCGSGMSSALLAQMGADVSLVDIAPKALEFARSNFANLGLQATFYQQDALQMELEDGTFDVVWNCGVLEHFYDPGKLQLIREMRRITRPGGLVFIAVPNHLHLPFMLGKKLAELRGIWPYGFEDDLTPRRLDGLARQAGLESYELFAYNAVGGWAFLPLGKRLMRFLGLDTLEMHSRRTRWGHMICLNALKPEA